MPQLVLGTAVGYAEVQIAPFVRSLRATGYRGDVILLVDRRDLAALRTSPLLADVHLIGVANWLPLRFALLRKGAGARWIWRPLQALLWTCMRLLDLVPLSEAWRLRTQVALGALLYPPTESRFLRYYAVLRDGSHDRILLSDVRDVLFQTNPFTALPESGLAISLEVSECTLGSEPWNRSRIELIYGDEVLQRVATCPISCSGVTAGDRASMLRYLALMTRHIVALSRSTARVGWFDQAIHNVVLRTRWHEPLHALRTLSSPVATLGLLSDTELRFDARGRLLNRDGTTVSIVHQYDRKPATREQLLRALAASA